MTKAKKKYLIETSAVRPALGESTPAHVQHYVDATSNGSQWTSHYIRMEVIRRWVCDLIRIAITIDEFKNIADALAYLEQDFSPRNVKGVLAGLATALRSEGVIHNNRAAAEEVGRQAVGWLSKFDYVFESRINDHAKCQLGRRILRVDFNWLLADLHSFYESFKTPVTDCEVNAFLDTANSCGRARKLIADPAVAQEKVAQNLQGFTDKSKWITCTECQKIGDLVIALEQPRTWTLVHIDGLFNTLCDKLQRPHIAIDSLRAVEKKQALLAGNTTP